MIDLSCFTLRKIGVLTVNNRKGFQLLSDFVCLLFSELPLKSYLLHLSIAQSWC